MIHEGHYGRGSQALPDSATSDNPTHLLNVNLSEQDDDVDTESRQLQNLAEFQKEGLYRAMAEYRADAAQYKARYAEAQRKLNASCATSAVVTRHWHQLIESLRLLLTRVDGNQPEFDSIFVEKGDTAEPWHNRLLEVTKSELSNEDIEDGLQERCEETVNLVAKLLLKLKDTVLSQTKFLDEVRHHNEISQLENVVIKRLTEENAKLLAAQRAFDDVGVELQVRSLQRDSLEERHQKLEREFRTLQSQHDVNCQQLRKSERLNDRLKRALNKASGHWADTGFGFVRVAKKSESCTVESGGVVDVELKSVQAEREIFAQKEASMMKELDAYKQDRIILRQEVDSLRHQLSYIPEERIHSHSAFADVSRRCNFLHAELHQTRQMLENSKKEVEQLLEGRRQFRETVEDDFEKRKKEYEMKILQIEADVARLRAWRDLHKNQLSSSQHTVQHIQTQYSMVVKLNSIIENHRQQLLRKLQLTNSQPCENGIIADGIEIDQPIQDYFRDEAHKELEAKQEALRQKVAELEIEVKRCKDAEAEHLERIAALEKASDTSLETSLQENIKLQARLAFYQGLFGSNLKVDGMGGKSVDSADLVSSLSMRCRDLQNTVTELEEENKRMQKNEEALQEEINEISDTFDQYQKQFNKVELEMRQCREALARADAKKHASDMELYNTKREVIALTEKLATFKKHAELLKDEGQLAKLREKNYHQQLSYVEKESAMKQIISESLKKKSTDMAYRLLESESKVFRLTQRAEDAESSLKQYISYLEDERAKGNTMHREILALNTQVNSLKVSVSQGGRAELERLRARVICGACHVEEKSVSLVVCGHTFCGECVQNSLKSRQRKCPTCSAIFGSNDVKQLFL